MVRTLSDVNSEVPLSPSHLLTMKIDVILPPPGTFSRPDIYSRSGWWRVQHIAGEFWTWWRKEFLQILQVRQKWNNWKRNFKVGDVVLLREDSIRNEWPVARIVETEPDSNGLFCSVKLKFGDASLDSQKVSWWPISSRYNSQTKGAIAEILRRFILREARWSGCYKIQG